MATTDDIVQRIAWRLPIAVEDLARFAAELDALVADALAKGETVELMTFGTLAMRHGSPEFTAHASLLQENVEREHDA